MQQIGRSTSEDWLFQQVSKWRWCCRSGDCTLRTVGPAARHQVRRSQAALPSSRALFFPGHKRELTDMMSMVWAGRLFELTPWSSNVPKFVHVPQYKINFTWWPNYIHTQLGLPWWLSQESACDAGDLGSILEFERPPGEGSGNSLQYACLGNPHGQRDLVVYSPWGQESDTTEQLNLPTSNWSKGFSRQYSPWLLPCKLVFSIFPSSTQFH